MGNLGLRVQLRWFVMISGTILLLAAGCGQPVEHTFPESGLLRALTPPCDLRVVSSPIFVSPEDSDVTQVVENLELKLASHTLMEAPLSFTPLADKGLFLHIGRDEFCHDFDLVRANPDWHVAMEAESFRLHKANWPHWKATTKRGAPLWWEGAELSADATVRHSAFYDVLLTAMGIRVFESVPRVALVVDDKSIGEFDIPVARRSFEAAVSATAYIDEGDHTFGVRLVNKTVDADGKQETGVFVKRMELVPKHMVVVPEDSVPPGGKLTARYETGPLAAEQWRAFAKEHNFTRTDGGLLISGEGGLDVQGEYRPAIFAPPGTVFEWTVRLPRKPRLAFGMGTEPGSRLHAMSAVKFSVDLIPHGIWGSQRRLLDKAVDSWTDPANGNWCDVSFDLGRWAQQKVTLRFSTAPASAEGLGWACSFWSEPRLRGQTDSTENLNVVILLIDALRKDHLGCYGYAKQTSPTIDAVAARGALFENCVSQFPSTCGSIASLLTGLYPVSHGCYTAGALIHPQAETLAQALAAQGYATYAISDNRLIDPKYGYGRGFDRLCSLEDRHGSGIPRQTPARLIQNVVRECLDAAEGRPFFVYVHSVYPHDWYWAPREFREMFTTDPDGSAHGPSLWTWRAFDGRARGPTAPELREMLAFYDAEIRYADALTGDILDALQNAGVRDRTLLVLTADHGEEFLDHGGWDHGRTLFREVLDVPLIIQGPTVPSHGRVRHTVRLIDVVPTVLDMLEFPRMSCHGESLLPLMRGEDDGRRMAISEGGLPEKRGFSIRGERYKYVRTESVSALSMKKGEFLFDLVEDPLEQQNLLAEKPEVVAQMKAEVDSYLARYSGWLPKRKAQSLSDISSDVLEDLKSLGYVE